MPHETPLTPPASLDWSLRLARRQTHGMPHSATSLGVVCSELCAVSWGVHDTATRYAQAPTTVRMAGTDSRPDLPPTQAVSASQEPS